MSLRHVPQVVDVHIESFPSFFLTFLGSPFLHQLYSAIVNDPSGIAFVCERSERIIGFVAGTDNPNGFYQRLLRHGWWRFALASLGAVLRRPSIVPRLLRALRKPAEVAAHSDKTGTLMSIAVYPAIQGEGIGQALVSVFLVEARNRGLKMVNLTTDSADNQAVNRFYQRLGFVCARTFETPEGRQMNEYILDLYQRNQLTDQWTRL